MSGLKKAKKNLIAKAVLLNFLLNLNLTANPRRPLGNRPIAAQAVASKASRNPLLNTPWVSHTGYAETLY